MAEFNIKTDYQDHLLHLPAGCLFVITKGPNIIKQDEVRRVEKKYPEYGKVLATIINLNEHAEETELMNGTTGVTAVFECKSCDRFESYPEELEEIEVGSIEKCDNCE